jgi:hypothetical protein
MEVNFRELSICHRVAHTFVQAIRLFEQDHTTLCHGNPAAKTDKRHLTPVEEYWCPIADFIRQ